MTKYNANVDGEATHDAFESVSKARSAQDILDGREFSTGELFQDVAGGSTVNVYLENPADSGIAVFVQTRALTEGKFYKQKLVNVTVDTAGTTINSVNRKLSNGEATTITERNVTFSSPQEEFNKKVLGSGETGSANVSGAIGPTDFGVILEEGDNLVLQAENATNSNLDVTLDVDFIEIPIEEIEELQ